MVEIDIEENDNLDDDIYYDTGRHSDNLKRNARNSHDIINNIIIVVIFLIWFYDFLNQKPSIDSLVFMPISSNFPPDKGGNQKYTAVNYLKVKH